MAANAPFALKPGVWFLRVRFVIFAPDSRREPSPPSGRKSTQPTVQILEASSGCFRLERSPGGACTHWKAPPSHGARKKRSFADPLLKTTFIVSISGSQPEL